MSGTSTQGDAQSSLLPLTGLRVVEISDGKTEMCGRFLADLGADVILVEPPAGAGSRQQEPLIDGISLYFATHNANKRSVALDIADSGDRARLERLIGAADIFIETTRPGTLESLGLGVSVLLARKPELVVLSITDFGQSGPYRDYHATNSVHVAMGGVLCRSGLPGLPPLLPPGSLAHEAVTAQAAWCALVAYWQRLRTGVGEHLDFSIHEATAQILDPGFGATDDPSAGKSPLELAVRGRPLVFPLYPIFPCADGYVRICVLSPRQWEGMSAWLGTSHEFTDPSFGNIGKRLFAADRLNALIAALFCDQSAVDLVAEGQRRGVPIAVLSTPTEVMRDPHFNARGAFVPLELAPGLKGLVPVGFMEVNGVRAGIRQPAPGIGEHTAEVFGSGLPSAPVRPAAVATTAPRRPFEGLRVLDLGIIVAGAELGRLFADQGAEVIKVENRAFPDGGRQSLMGEPMTDMFAQGHRNKQGLGINLKSTKGRDLFKQLVAQSDVVMSNFKPGTLESLGLGYQELKQVNPRLVMADSSALGSTGPLSRSMGYGPLVRATSGLTGLWCYPEVDNSYSDGVTIFPDHFAARVSAVGVLASLIARERSGAGGTVSVSQAETFFTATSAHFLRESIKPGSFIARGNVSEHHAPDSVFPCAGDDEWCVVSVQEEQHWPRLARAIGRPDLLDDARFSTARGRIEHRSEVEAALVAWTSLRAPREVMQTLQAAGVPAGIMLRLTEYEDDPQFRARDFFRILNQPGLPAPLVTQNGPTKALRLPDPEIRPAPFQGQHTREIAVRLLGLSEAEVDELIAQGDLEIMVGAKSA